MDRVLQAEFAERTCCINCKGTHLTELSRGAYTDEPLAGFLAADPWGENPMPFLQEATWSLVRCDDCSQVFQRRILTDAWNERRFSQWMSTDAIRAFEDRLGPAFPRRFGAAARHVEHVLRIEKLTRPVRAAGEAVRILDFGCGFGDFLEACAHFGFEASGVDRAPARRDASAVKIMPSLPEAAGPQYHAITAFEVLEHVDEPSDILAALSGHLMPGGILVLETPDCTGVTDIKTRSDYLKVHPLEHINAFTHGTLKSIAERNGFSLISRGASLVTTDPLRVARTLAKERLGRAENSTQLYFRKI
ncbi:class I SAM-dependent methyltransferase [Aestuariivirga sp.]|uniref:class I SAM-dependent methyltransferase n=1 Tax=Aestuariivirga sp. TaxID=2650926 RepID=UPI0039E4E58B